MNNAEIIELTHRHMVDVYGCLPLAFARGHGAYLYDADGNRYLDFFCGLAVTSLGHGNPRVVRAIKEQAEKLTHVSNVFHTEPTARLVERLANHFGDGKVFLGNSGAEANEAAIKLARRWGSNAGGGRFEILTTLGSFHGRTLATVSATGQERYHQGFQPMMPGFRFVPFDDVAALDRARLDETVGVMVEPIQGEGGVVVPRADYLKRVRDWCDRNKLLLILDEIQTGMGRTGRFFAYDHVDIKPDIVTLAKALGGGLPIGAMIARSEIASSFTPGSHGSTFGGNPVACAAAVAVIDALEQDGVLENASSVGGYILERLSEFARSCDRIVEVRGLGMIIGVVLKHDPRPIVEDCLKNRLLVNGTAGNVLRLLPPLNLTREEADAGLAIIENALKNVPVPEMKRDFLDLSSLSTAELDGLLALGARLKAELKIGLEHPYLRGRTLAMVFQKPSLRTRVTFETGMAQLGGHAIYLAPNDIGIGERESVKDVARNISRAVDLIMIRTFSHETAVELAREATVPVINGLTDLLHPCQLLADLMTLQERFGRDLRKVRVAFVGDGFNLAQSWIEAAALAGFELRLASPKGYEPEKDFMKRLSSEEIGTLTDDPAEAVKDADVVYTDTWTSMGREKEAVQRRRDFKGFQVNDALLKNARKGAIVMHCLPAHRGEEITDEVIDGPRSVVLDQAENRLHAQKAVMVWLIRPEILQTTSPSPE